MLDKPCYSEIMEQNNYKWDNPAATNPPDIAGWWGNKTCDSSPKRPISDSLRHALSLKGRVPEWMTDGHLEYARQDLLIDNQLDEEDYHHHGSADTFMTPVGHTKQRRLELSDEEPPLGQKKPRSWVQMESMRRQPNEATFSLAM